MKPTISATESRQEHVISPLPVGIDVEFAQQPARGRKIDSFKKGDRVQVICPSGWAEAAYANTGQIATVQLIGAGIRLKGKVNVQLDEPPAPHKRQDIWIHFERLLRLPPEENMGWNESEEGQEFWKSENWNESLNGQEFWDRYRLLKPYLSSKSLGSAYFNPNFNYPRSFEQLERLEGKRQYELPLEKTLKASQKGYAIAFEWQRNGTREFIPCLSRGVFDTSLLAKTALLQEEYPEINFDAAEIHLKKAFTARQKCSYLTPIKIIKYNGSATQNCPCSRCLPNASTSPSHRVPLEDKSNLLGALDETEETIAHLKGEIKRLHSEGYVPPQGAWLEVYTANEGTSRHVRYNSREPCFTNKRTGGLARKQSMGKFGSPDHEKAKAAIARRKQIESLKKQIKALQKRRS
jgi:hypothetical protein